MTGVSVSYPWLFMTEGAGGRYFGGKTTEPSISSSEETGPNELMVMPGPESHSCLTERLAVIPNNIDSFTSK